MLIKYEVDRLSYAAASCALKSTFTKIFVEFQCDTTQHLSISIHRKLTCDFLHVDVIIELFYTTTRFDTNVLCIRSFSS